MNQIEQLEQEVYWLKIIVSYLLRNKPYSAAEELLVEQAIRRLNFPIRK